MDPNIAILAGGVSSRMKKALADAADLDASLRRDAAEKPKAMIGVGGSGRPFHAGLASSARCTASAVPSGFVRSAGIG